MTRQTLQIVHGFADRDRQQAARLFWTAFSGKLGRVMGPEERALHFLRGAINPAFALTARSPDGRLLGMAGFKTEAGGLVEGGLRQFAQVYGWLGTLWRVPLLAVLERPLQPGVFQMDGIFVAPSARGQGVGTALLQAIRDEALARGHREVQLDVIDHNDGARRLYERFGFRAMGEERTGPLRHVFGFSSATRMSLALGRG